MAEETENIDPWGSSVIKDYDHLFAKFGMSKVDDSILNRIKKKSIFFRRGIIFAHRDFDKFLTAYEKGEKVAAMSGIKPSGEFHLGSKMTADELIFFQQVFGAKVFYSIANLEAYADNGTTFEQSRKNAISNVADLLALGLDPDNAYIYEQSEEKRVMNLAYLFARKTTNATLRAIYGDRNIGLYFSALTQVGDILMPQLKEFGGPKQVVVPIGVDQDPHLRLTRDIAAKFQEEYRFLPPTSIYHKFFHALNGEAKMSKRDPMNMLTLNDDPELAAKKIMRTFTGGRESVEMQRKLGGEIDKCVVFELFTYHFEEDDKKLEERKAACLGGKILCGECKAQLACKVKEYLKQHQEKKKKLIPKAKEILESQCKC